MTNKNNKVMKANELMIGDWVVIDEPDRYAGATGQIHSLMYHQERDSAYFHVFIQGKYGYLTRDVCSDDIRPIPLTPKILEKNGFILDTYSGKIMSGKWWTRNNFVIHENMNDSVGRNNFKYEYVHQLQHALRLCGIEKEIEL